MKNAQIARSSRGLHFRLLLGSIVIGSFGAWVLRQPVVIEAGGPWMWLFFLNACLIGGLALGRMDAWLPEASALPVEAPPGSPIWQQRGRIALAGAVILSGWVVARLWPDYTHWDGTVLPWLVSLGLVLLGSIWLGKGSKGQTPTETPAPRPDFPLPRWVEITGFLLIAALAVFLRVYRLDVFPPGIYVDETTASLDALRILEGNAVSPFATGWYETPNGYLYFMAGMFKLFGANWYTLKAISILPALLTVLAVYPLGRMMFGPAAGLAAMLFTAVSHWHLTMSRFGWNETAVPLFQVLSTYFLLRGLRERRLRDFTIGGLITGLMIYTYLSSRLALATIGLFLIYWIIADREGVRKSLKRHMPGLLMFGFAFLVAFAPLGVTYLTNHLPSPTASARSVSSRIPRGWAAWIRCGQISMNISDSSIKLVMTRADSTCRKNPSLILSPGLYLLLDFSMLPGTYETGAAGCFGCGCYLVWLAACSAPKSSRPNPTAR